MSNNQINILKCVSCVFGLLYCAQLIVSTCSGGHCHKYEVCDTICADSDSVLEITGFNATLWEERANASLITHERLEMLRHLINTRCRMELTLCEEKEYEKELIAKRDSLKQRNVREGVYQRAY